MLKFFFSKDSDIFPKQKLKPVLDKIFEQKLNELGKETFQKNFLEFQKKSGEIKPHENLYGTYVDYYLNCYLFEYEQESKSPFPFIHSLFYIIIEVLKST